MVRRGASGCAGVHGGAMTLVGAAMCKSLIGTNLAFKTWGGIGMHRGALWLVGAAM